MPRYSRLSTVGLLANKAASADVKYKAFESVLQQRDLAQHMHRPFKLLTATLFLDGKRAVSCDAGASRLMSRSARGDQVHKLAS